MSYQINSFQGTSRIGRPCADLTKHAAIRLQQRGVNLDVLDCLLTYGHHEPDHKGCLVVTFDSRAMDDLSRFEPRYMQAKSTDSRSLYAVVDSDGVVVTTGHRYRRVPRDLSLSALRPGRSRSPKALWVKYMSKH